MHEEYNYKIKLAIDEYVRTYPHCLSETSNIENIDSAFKMDSSFEMKDSKLNLEAPSFYQDLTKKETQTELMCDEEDDYVKTMQDDLI